MMTDAGEDYARAGFGGGLEPGRRPGLIIVDPARAYVDPACPLYAGVEQPVEQMKVLLASARRRGIPTFLTRVLHDARGINGGVFFRKVPALRWFAADSPHAAYIEGLEPDEDETEIVKQYPSAFAGTSLAAMLTARGIDTLVIAGLSTSGCIRATATDAMQSGFIPIVVREAVGDRLPGPHEANLFDIQSKIGEVVGIARAMEIFEDAAS